MSNLLVCLCVLLATNYLQAKTFLVQTNDPINGSPQKGEAPALHALHTKECAQGWSSFQDSCYLMVGDYETMDGWANWMEAEANCTEMKNTLDIENTPHLTSIQTLEENEFVMSRLAGSGNYVYIGLHQDQHQQDQDHQDQDHDQQDKDQDQGAMSEWAWSDGSESNYTAWMAGEPSHAIFNHALGNCNIRGEWCDYFGYYSAPYVCEYTLLT